jgi:hypothetical protein
MHNQQRQERKNDVLFIPLVRTGRRSRAGVGSAILRKHDI